MSHRSRLILLLGALVCFAQHGEDSRILRPTDQAIVDPGPLSVIASAPGGGRLLLDGKELAAEAPATGVLTAVVEPAPGTHELTLAAGGVEKKVRFHVGGSPPPEFQPFKAHPPAVDCDACHEVASGGAWSIKDDVAGPSCMACHEAVTFPKIHTHPPAELEDCEMCHAPHVIREKSLDTSRRRSLQAVPRIE